MVEFADLDADGAVDRTLPDFTPEDLEVAVAWRQSVAPDRDIKRRDYCPHSPMCPSVASCVAALAWYLRHRRELHHREGFGS